MGTPQILLRFSARARVVKESGPAFLRGFVAGTAFRGDGIASGGIGALMEYPTHLRSKYVWWRRKG